MISSERFDVLRAPYRRRPAPTAALLAAVSSLAAGSVGCMAADDTPPLATAEQALSSNDYMLVGLGGKCMDVAWGSSDSGTSVNLFDCNGTPAQRWHYDAATTELRALGKCLDVPGAVFDFRNHLQIWDCNGTVAQHYSLAPLGFNGSMLQPTASTGFCVEVAGGFTDNWTPIQLFDCNGTASQEWHFAVPQVPDTAPLAPTVTLGTITVRDHTGGTTVITEQPALYAQDRALFETGLRWSERINGGAWTEFWSTAAQEGIDAKVGALIPAMSDGNVYELKVTAFNSAGTSDSNVITIRRTAPAAPTNLRFDSVTKSSVRVLWNDNSSDEDGFRVNYSLSSVTTGANATSLTVGSLGAGINFCFDVVAFNRFGTSAPVHGCVTTKAFEERTALALLGKQIFGSAVWYFGNAGIAGTLTRVHVPSQLPVTAVLFLKPGVAGTECLNPRPANYVAVIPGSDLNIAALFGSATPAVNNPGFAACALLSELVNVPNVVIETTYRF
jgi:hypothetical protein